MFSRDMTRLLCILVSLGITYMLLLLAYMAGNSMNKERCGDESIQSMTQRSPPAKSEDNILSVSLIMVDVIRGPEIYQEKLELILASMIKALFLLPPSKRPYNLKNGLDPLRHNGQLGQPKIIDKILKGQTNGFFVECGGGNGERYSNSLFFELKRNWTGLLVEPSPTLFSELKTKNRKSYVLNACLSIHNYAEEAYFHDAAEWGGLKEVFKSLNTTVSKSIRRKNIKVQCFPFFSVLLAMGNPTVDLFSLDIEGAEMGVFATIPWHRVNIRLILLEVDHGDKAAYDAFLDSKGYDVHTDIGQDKIYVKRDQRASMN